MTDRVHLLVAPEAGRGRAATSLDTVRATIREEGYELVDLTAATVEASRRAASEAVTAGAERLVVVGGDGMVHTALPAVAGTDTVLGVVPVGTGNDFVRGFGAITDDAAAATRVALGPARPVDAIRVGDRWVASVATAGFSGDVNARANRLRFPTGSSRYTVATMLELPALQARQVCLTVDGVAHECRSVLFAVANTGWFGGGMHIAPDARADDGLLDITVVGAIGRLELLRFFRLVFSGRHLSHPAVHTLRGRSVTITGDELDLWGDGEPVGSTPATLEVVPGALRVAC